MTLAMLAHAVLVVAALTDHTRHSRPPELIGLTCNELQHLFAVLLARPAADPAHRLRWSVWRRRHQARARTATTAGRPTDHEDQRAACRPGAGSVATCQNRIVTLDKSGELWHGAAASQQRWSSHCSTPPRKFTIYGWSTGVLRMAATSRKGSCERSAPRSWSHD
jgi:hypothetical protein